MNHLDYLAHLFVRSAGRDHCERYALQRVGLQIFAHRSVQRVRDGDSHGEASHRLRDLVSQSRRTEPPDTNKLAAAVGFVSVAAAAGFVSVAVCWKSSAVARYVRGRRPRVLASGAVMNVLSQTDGDESGNA